MTRHFPFLLLAAAALPALPAAAAPCVRPTRAGTQVQGDVRVCPGRYRIADPAERGVIIAVSSGTRVDLTGVTFLDSAGLCVLAAAHRRAARGDVRLRVVATSRAVIRPMQITGLYDLLDVTAHESGAA